MDIPELFKFFIAEIVGVVRPFPHECIGPMKMNVPMNVLALSFPVVMMPSDVSQGKLLI